MRSATLIEGIDTLLEFDPGVDEVDLTIAARKLVKTKKGVGGGRSVFSVEPFRGGWVLLIDGRRQNDKPMSAFELKRYIETRIRRWEKWGEGHRARQAARIKLKEDGLTEGDGHRIADKLRQKYGVELWMSDPRWGNDLEPDIVKIDSIVVPVESRGEGIGSKVMNDLVDWADANTYILALEPSSDFGGSSKRLRVFYSRFGFVSNSGRNKDFRSRQPMIRYPVGYDGP